jgi:hypothetical protein
MKRGPVVEKPRAVTEVMPVKANAEPATLITESGRQRVVRSVQPKKRKSGISVRFDGDPNMTADKDTHSQKTDLPRVETEEGTVKEMRLQQSLKARESILRIVAGNSNETVVNSQHPLKHFSPMTRTLCGTVIERRCLQVEKAKAERLFKRELEPKTTL